MKLASVERFCLALLFASSICYAQSGTIRGTVLDPSGAAIAGATVEIQNPVSHYSQSAKTDTQGTFSFDNIPFNNYHLTAAASGFQSSRAGRGRAIRDPGGGEVSLKSAPRRPR